MSSLRPMSLLSRVTPRAHLVSPCLLHRLRQNRVRVDLRAFSEEGFRLDREDNCGLCAGVACTSEADCHLNALSPHCGSEGGRAATDFHRHPNHVSSFRVTAAIPCEAVLRHVAVSRLMVLPVSYLRICQTAHSCALCPTARVFNPLTRAW